MKLSGTLARTLSTAVIGVVVAAQPNVAHAADVTPSLLSDCPSGYFCVWSGTNYTGTIQRFAATNAYRTISLSATKSYYNHRSQRTWLHEDPDGGGSSTCINPGASKTSTTGWQTTAEAVYLATVTNC
jgi:hypothetical protein